jgi:carbamoyl-phosphate synthase large subunit
MPRDPSIKRVLVLGSGGIRIGQAGEFDYSGSQVLKALKEEGIYTVLINPNIATIQTDPQLSDKVYLLPLTIDFIEDVIKKEKPDSIMLSFGGQTALNAGVELSKKGILEKYGVRVLGTPIKSIEDTEDRDLFRHAMMACGVDICNSATATTKEQAWEIAKRIGFPLMIRVAFTLGGQGSGVAYNETDFNEIVDRALASSVISQILVEEYVGGWKEIEYEVVRDKDDNTITVCNMENFDPVGIHTGESIVIAPSQTLTNEEYHMLRSASIRAIRHLKIIGECNIQYALHPTSKKFVAIEVNARLSRSSALASKATGYPLAYIAAKLGLGYSLTELKNSITNITTACFEPALDYVALKIPRWNMEKFRRVSRRIGPQMKSVGEVMGIGRNFEESFQKAIRMLDIDLRGIVVNGCEDEYMQMPLEKLEYELSHPTDIRYLMIPPAIKRGISIDRLYELTKIDKWFLYKIQHCVEIETMLRGITLLSEDVHKIKAITYAKRYGFSDGQIARCMKTDSHTIRRFRHKTNIQPMTKQIDTLAAEWPAKTNYLYMTYGGDKDDLDYAASRKEFQAHPVNKKVIVLGSGVYRIGSSVEFDWGCVNMAWALKQEGVKEVIMVNYNPETVSTDYDISNKLYFEELSAERVLDICHKEYAYGVVVSAGGQIAQNLVSEFTKYDKAFRASGVLIMGTEGKNIDKAENRKLFSQIMDQLGIKQPEWAQLRRVDDAIIFANKVGFPVLVRPSYVLSGAAMRVASDESELRDFLELAAVVSKDNPVVISKFFTNAREIECDGVGDGTDVFVAAVVEHIENAGVHSGDATMSIPAPTLKYKIWERITKLTQQIAKALDVRGPFNIQYLVKDDEIYVIEMNLRSSRSMPYASKAVGVNIIKLAAHVIMGGKIPQDLLRRAPPPYVLIKAPMFSFMRLEGADPILGVEMMSTGEVACIGEDIPDALIKSMLAAEYNIPLDTGNVLFTVAGDQLKQAIIPMAKKLHLMGYKIFATTHTAQVLTDNGVPTTSLHKVREPEKSPNILEYILKRKLSMVINIPVPSNDPNNQHIYEDEYVIRRKAVEFNIPVITNIQLADALIDALFELRKDGIVDKKTYHEKVKIASLDEYHKRLKINYW